jgi:hypothetical protein
MCRVEAVLIIGAVAGSAAPTPRMVAEQMLDSKYYRACLSLTRRTCGRMAKRMNGMLACHAQLTALQRQRHIDEIGCRHRTHGRQAVELTFHLTDAGPHVGWFVSPLPASQADRRGGFLEPRKSGASRGEVDIGACQRAALQ